MGGKRWLVIAVATALLVVGTSPGADSAPAGRANPAPPVGSEFPPPVPVVDGFYGTSVAVDGERFVVGAPWDDMVIGETTYLAVGSIWMYERDGGVWGGTEFRPPYWEDADDNYGRFGEAVALDGDVMAVGAPYDGTAWAYRHDGTWLPLELVPAREDIGTFGNSVAVSGDRVVVGAPGSGYGGLGVPGTGSAHVFEWSGAAWIETELTITGAADGDQAGYGDSGVAIDGDTVVVGVSQGVPYGEWFGTGRVHVYTWTGAIWAEQILNPAGASINDAFGWSVAIEGDRIVVGAPGDDTVDTNSGAIYVFDRVDGVWSQTLKKTLPDGGSYDTYGWSVGISGGRVAVGAPGRNDVGAVVVYESLAAEADIVAEAVGGEGRAIDQPPGFGRAVDIDGHLIGVGAPYENTDGLRDAGTAALLEYLTCDGREATIVGTEGDDTLTGTSKNDVIVGRGGDDSIDGGGGSDFLCGDEGDDEIDGGAGNDRVFGGTGNDVLVGGEGGDLLSGQGGHDHLTGGPGDDTLNGGRGADTVFFTDAAAGVTVDLEARTATGHGDDRVTRCEHVDGSDHGDDITGHGGKNKINGLGGDDVIDGAGKRDILTGGPGDDTIHGGDGADAIAGNQGDDVLYGEDGNDKLKGHTGFDILDGGNGTDVCESGENQINCE